MLKISKLVNKPPVKRLVKLWAQRYLPDLSALSSGEGSFTTSELVEVASTEGRTKTIAKVQRLIQTDCDRAGLKTNTLFSYIPNVVNLADARRLAEFAGPVYLKALEIYLQQSPPTAALIAVPLAAASSPSQEAIDLSNNTFSQWAKRAINLPAIEQLAMALEPAILQLQEQHLTSRDLRTIGFMSTQFHFSSEFVLQHLTLPEKVLLGPYFKFIEEQVCIPWQRVCAAAAKHELRSPSLAVVEQMLPVTHEIARTVYSRSVQLYPAHHSRRGGLGLPDVMASVIRDLNMLQSYLWLCVLEESMAAVEQELIPLCVIVFPTVELKWELVAQMTKLLMDEILARMEPQHQQLVLPYTQAMQQLFSNLQQKAAELSTGLDKFVEKEEKHTLKNLQKINSPDM